MANKIIAALEHGVSRIFDSQHRFVEEVTSISPSDYAKYDDHMPIIIECMGLNNELLCRLRVDKALPRRVVKTCTGYVEL